MPEKLKKREYDEVSKENNGQYQDLVEHCLDLYDEIDGSEYRKAKIEEIEKSRKQYDQKSEPTSDPWPGASNIVLPLTTISVDNLEPRTVSGMVGRKPYVRFVEESETEQSEATRVIQDWFQQELEYGVKLEHEAGSLAHMLLIEGTVYPICKYERMEETVKDFAVPKDEQEAMVWMQSGAMFDEASGVWMNQSGPMLADKKEVLYEGGKIDYAPFTDIFIPDEADKWEETPVIRKVRPTYAELERNVEEKEGYLNIGPWLLREAGEGKLTETQQTPGQLVDDVKVTGREAIECIECVLSYTYKKEDEEDEDVKNWQEEKYLVQIATERQILVRLVKLRDLYWKNQHFIRRVRLFPEAKKAYGTGIYGKIKSIQDGASKSFNHAINIAEVVLIPWFFFTNKAGLKGEVLLKPGAGVQVDAIDQIMFPSFNLNPKDWIDYIYLWSQFWERLVSIGDLQIGRQTEKDKTATETLSVIQEGNVKHNYQSKTFREEFLSILRCLYDLYYQHMPLNKTFRYEGQDVPIKRGMMSRPFNFRLTGSTERSNKLIKRKETEDLAMLTAQNPLFAPIANPVKQYEEILKEYGHSDTKEYIDPFMAQLSGLMLKITPEQKQQIMGLIQQTLQSAEQLAEAAKE